MVMKLSSIRSWVLAITLIAGMCWETAMCAQEAPAGISQVLPLPQSARSISASVSEARAVSISLVGIEVTAPLTRENMDVLIPSVMQEYVRQGLDFSIKGYFRPAPVIVLYEDPKGKEKVRMAVGATVQSKVAVKAPLKYLRFKFPKAVRFFNTGPFEDLGKTHLEIENTARMRSPKLRSGWPVIVQILNNPNQVKPEDNWSVVTIPLL